MKKLLAAALSAGLFSVGSATAAVYDFSAISTEGQSYEGVILDNMTLTSEEGWLYYTNNYGGGILAGEGGASDIYMNFSSAINGISIRAGDGAGDPDAFGITAYEFGTNILLGSWYSPVFGGSSEPEWYTLTVLANNIGRIVFDPCNSGVCPGGLYDIGPWGVTGGMVITSITTDVPSPVPEPEAYAMLLAGLGLLSFTARRRKQAA